MRHERFERLETFARGAARNAVADGVGVNANGSWKIAGHLQNIAEAARDTLSATDAELDFVEHCAVCEIAAALNVPASDL